MEQVDHNFKTKNTIFRSINKFDNKGIHFNLVVKYIDFEVESLFFVNY